MRVVVSAIVVLVGLAGAATQANTPARLDRLGGGGVASPKCSQPGSPFTGG